MRDMAWPIHKPPSGIPAGGMGWGGPATGTGTGPPAGHRLGPGPWKGHVNNVERKARREADAERAWALKCAVLDDEVRDKTGAHVPTPTALRLAASQAITEQVEGKAVQRVENTGAG